MPNDPLPSRPVNSSEKVLRDKFAESVAKQSELMDTLGRQLITLELAIPGIYATVLKLIQGQDATLTPDGWLYFTFVCWSLALLLTLVSLIPRNWKVDPSMLKPDPAGRNTDLSLEEFFHKSAQYKRRLLIASITFFTVGTLSSVFLLF